MKGYSHQSGQGQGHGTMDASGTGRMSAEGEGTSLSWDPYSLAIMPTAMTTAEHETTGTSSNAVHAESAHTQSSISEGWNEADASTTSSTDSDTTSEAETSGTSHVEGTSQAESVGETFAYGTSTNQSEERSTSTTTGENYSVSRGVTPSESTSEGESIAESVTPFHELKKRWRVASREFLSLADFLTTKLIQLKSQPKMHWAIQPPEGKTVFFKARFVKPLAGGRERLSAFRDRVFSKPYYSTHTEVMTEPRAATETIQAADAAHVLMLTTRPHGALPFPTPRDESDDEDFDAWGTEKPAL
jgi:hypothetical protein